MPNWFEMLSTHLPRGGDTSDEVPAFVLAATRRILALWVFHLQTAKTDVQVNRKYKGRQGLMQGNDLFTPKRKVKRLTGRWGGYGARAVRGNLESSLLANKPSGQAEHPESKNTKPGPKPAETCRSQVRWNRKTVTRKNKTWRSWQRNMRPWQVEGGKMRLRRH